jgi:3-oxoacyl-[acyl-carrier-protein] synthase-3
LPLAITLNLASQLKDGHCRVCLTGFGGGLVWAAMLLRLGGLSFCEMIDFQ